MNFRTNSISVLTIAIAGISSTVSLPSFAAVTDNNRTTLEEVIVTAQKRAESLQDVPISVAALSGDAIDKAGITSLEGMSAIMPNVTITQEQISDRISIRGIASGGNQGFDQSVGLFSNGVYLARGAQFRSAFLDVESVEVLRGPQATLFGKNTIAGAVNLTSRQPTQEFEAQLNTSFETELESRHLGGFISGALTDTLSGRFAFKTSEDKGWVENAALNDKRASSDTSNYRLSLAWEATDDLSFNLTHEAFDMESDGKGFEVIHDESINPDGSVSTTPICRFDGDCALNYQNSSTNVDGSPGFTEDEYSDVNTQLTSLSADYALGDYTLTLVSGYSESEIEELNPGMHQPFATINTIAFEAFEQFSQEIRITSPGGEAIDWLAGLYYETNDLSFEDNIHLHATNILGGAVPNNVNVRTDFEQESKTVAAFAQGTWNINEATRLTLGLRYGAEEKQARQVYRMLAAGTDTRLADIITEPGAAGLAAAFKFDEHDTAKQSRKQENWSPSVNLQYDLTADVMVYSSASIGFKSGGFDARLAQSALDFEFDQEKAVTVELGSKGRFMDDRAELNLAFFRTEYKDLQFSSYNGGLSFLVDNAASAELTGLEFESRLLVNENLTLSGGGSWLDFEYQDFTNGPCDAYQQAVSGASLECSADRSGGRAPNTPEYTFNLSADWQQAISDVLLLELSATLAYEDEFFVSSDNDSVLLQDASTKLDLRVALSDLSQDAWTVSLLVKNLTGEETFHYGTDVPLTPGARFVRTDAPRTATVNAVYRF